MQSFINDQLAKMRKGGDDPHHHGAGNTGRSGGSAAAATAAPLPSRTEASSSSQQPPPRSQHQPPPPPVVAASSSSSTSSGLKGVELLPKVEGGLHHKALQPIPAAFEDPLWGPRSTPSTTASDKSVELDTEQLLSGLLGDLRREVLEMQSMPPQPPPQSVSSSSSVAAMPSPPAAVAGSFAVTSGNVTPPMHVAQYLQMPAGASAPAGAQWGTFMVSGPSPPQAMQGKKGPAFVAAPAGYQLQRPVAAGQPFQPQFLTPQQVGHPTVLYPAALPGGKTGILMPHGYQIVQAAPSMFGPRQPGQAMAVAPAGMAPKGMQLFPMMASPAPAPNGGGEVRNASAQGVNVAAAPFVPKPM